MIEQSIDIRTDDGAMELSSVIPSTAAERHWERLIALYRRRLG
jgi:hypothetical protein